MAKALLATNGQGTILQGTILEDCRTLFFSRYKMISNFFTLKIREALNGSTHHTNLRLRLTIVAKILANSQVEERQESDRSVVSKASNRHCKSGRTSCC